MDERCHRISGGREGGVRFASQSERVAKGKSKSPGSGKSTPPDESTPPPPVLDGGPCQECSGMEAPLLAARELGLQVVHLSSTGCGTRYLRPKMCPKHQSQTPSPASVRYRCRSTKISFEACVCFRRWHRAHRKFGICPAVYFEKLQA